MSYLHSMIHSIILIWLYISSFTDTNILIIIISGPTALLALRVHNISITSCSGVSKVLEKIFFKHVFNHLHENKLLYKFQSGFIPGHSTSHQLIELYHRILLALEAKQVTNVTFAAPYLHKKSKEISL
jgi:hypothetical protein